MIIIKECLARKLLDLINEYRKVAGYKINTQKSLAFLYTNNEKTEREIKETIPFTIAKKIIKYLRINLPKETQKRASCDRLHKRMALSSYPSPKVRCGDQEHQAATAQEWPTGTSPRPRSGEEAERSCPTYEIREGRREELPHT